VSLSKVLQSVCCTGAARFSDRPWRCCPAGRINRNVYKLCAAGALPHVRVLGAIRIAPDDLAAFW